MRGRLSSALEIALAGAAKCLMLLACGQLGAAPISASG
jgi:hypothetical protein